MSFRIPFHFRFRKHPKLSARRTAQVHWRAGQRNDGEFQSTEPPDELTLLRKIEADFAAEQEPEFNQTKQN